MKKILLLVPLVSLQCFGVTLSEWQKYSKEKKINYISDKSSDVDISLHDGSIKYSRLTSPRLEIIKKKIGAIHQKFLSFETKLNTEVDDDMYAQVGGLNISADLFFSEDNHLLGAQIQYFQTGCSHQNDDGDFIEGGGYYQTVKEAEKNNCFDNDVSWSGYSLTDHQFKELQHSDFMEWSGH